VLPVAEPRDAVLLHVLAPLLGILLQVAYPRICGDAPWRAWLSTVSAKCGGTVATLTPAQRDGATIRRWKRGGEDGVNGSNGAYCACSAFSRFRAGPSPKTLRLGRGMAEGREGTPRREPRPRSEIRMYVNHVSYCLPSAYVYLYP